MVDIQYVVALAMAITNLFKKQVQSEVVPLITIVMGVVLNVMNAWLFHADMLNAGKDALIATGVAVGLFTAADAVRKSNKTSFISDRKS